MALRLNLLATTSFVFDAAFLQANRPKIPPVHVTFDRRRHSLATNINLGRTTDLEVFSGTKPK